MYIGTVMKRKKDWLKQLNLSKTDKAYLAALIDGEGSFFLCTKKRWGKSYYEPQLQIHNCSLLFRDYMEQLGFRIYKEIRPTGWQTKYIVKVYGYGVYYLILELMPYLVLKKPVAILMKWFIEERLKQKMGVQLSNTKEMERLAKQIKLMNSKKREKLYSLEKQLITDYYTSNRNTYAT